MSPREPALSVPAPHSHQASAGQHMACHMDMPSERARRAPRGHVRHTAPQLLGEDAARTGGLAPTVAPAGGLPGSTEANSTGLAPRLDMQEIGNPFSSWTFLKGREGAAVNHWSTNIPRDREGQAHGPALTQMPRATVVSARMGPQGLRAPTGHVQPRLEGPSPAGHPEIVTPRSSEKRQHPLRKMRLLPSPHEAPAPPRPAE